MNGDQTALLYSEIGHSLNTATAELGRIHAALTFGELPLTTETADGLFDVLDGSRELVDRLREIADRLLRVSGGARHSGLRVALGLVGAHDGSPSVAVTAQRVSDGAVGGLIPPGTPPTPPNK